jgi:hypothetical protein
MFQKLWSTLTAPRKVWLVFVVAIVCSLTTLAAKNLITPTSKTVDSSLSKSDERALEAEIITILPTGFEPAELSRPRGPVVLSIFNRSGLEEVNVRLEAEAGPQLKEVRAPRKRLDIKEVVNLRPGRYRLTETNHPEWSCVITVTAQ